ncbi:Leucine aminopeptidase [Dionaea muscipula]
MRNPARDLGFEDKSKDYEVKVAFLQLAISARCREFYGEVEKTLKEVVRMKYLRPLYTTLARGGLGHWTGKEEEEKTGLRECSPRFLKKT